MFLKDMRYAEPGPALHDVLVGSHFSSTVLRAGQQVQFPKFRNWGFPLAVVKAWEEV